MKIGIILSLLILVVSVVGCFHEKYKPHDTPVTVKHIGQAVLIFRDVSGNVQNIVIGWK